MDDWSHLGADADETHATQLARFAEDWGYRGAPRPGAAAEDRPRRQTREGSTLLRHRRQPRRDRRPLPFATPPSAALTF